MLASPATGPRDAQINYAQRGAMQYGITVPPIRRLLRPTDPRGPRGGGRAGRLGWLLPLGPRPPLADTAGRSVDSARRYRPQHDSHPHRAVGPAAATPTPVKLARETVSLDHLSGGRLILGVGSGSGPWEYDYVGDEPNRWSVAPCWTRASTCLPNAGEPVLHTRRFYRFHGDGGPGRPEIAPTPLLPPPVQSPRIPIWVAGTWPKKPPFRRAARWDGVAPLAEGRGFGEYLTPREVREIATYVQQHRSGQTPWDVVIAGHTEGQDRTTDSQVVSEYAAAGATWWVEDVSPGRSAGRGKARGLARRCGSGSGPGRPTHDCPRQPARAAAWPAPLLAGVACLLACRTCRSHVSPSSAQWRGNVARRFVAAATGLTQKNRHPLLASALCAFEREYLNSARRLVLVG